MDPSTSHPPTTTDAAQRVTVIDGSTGLRLAIATLVNEHFPNATIEDIDPFSQTMRGPGFSFGTSGSAIVLGGVGTEAEAHDALKRLGSRTNCPPIIMLVAEALIPHRDVFIGAGAFDVLRKDAVSGQRLKNSLSRAFAFASAAATARDAAAVTDASAAVTAAVTAKPPVYGKFLFVDDGERVGVDVDGYRPISILSNGQMAQVYLAENIETGTQAVVKIFTAAPMRNIVELSQLIAIARRLRPIRGKAVVREFDSGVAAHFPYIVMEFLAKGDLRRRLKQPMDSINAVQVMNGILAALAELHGAEVCHADLKPESVFFRESGDVVLVDFNISTLFGKPVRNSPIRPARPISAARNDPNAKSPTAGVLGTPTYMSPEQGAGGEVSAASDLYSAGVIFFEMLTGEPPFTGDTAAQTIFRHLHDEVPLLPLKARHYQPIIDQLLAKATADRFQSANDVMRALAAVIASPA
jgi:tRNA A-37 threonylcarbamoyl transferase component Bud32